MTYIWIGIAVLVAIVAGSFVFKLATALLLPPEITGRRLLMQECRKHGVDALAIPRAAWDELVSQHITLAKLAPRTSGNWRVTLVDYLEIEAQLVASVMNGAQDQAVRSTREILIRHGAKVP